MANHRTLVSADVHEPKHITGSTSADAGKVITPLSGGASELRSLTPSEVGIEFVYGEMQALEVPSGNAFAVTAATDTLLYTGSDYVNLTSVRVPGAILDQANGITFNATTNAMIVPVTGDYRVSGWFNISSNTNNSKVGIRYTLNGTPAGATVKSDIASVGRVNNVGGFGYISLSAGDEIGIAMACDKSATLHVQDFVVMLDLLRTT